MSSLSLPIPDMPGLSVIVQTCDLDRQFNSADAEGLYALAYQQVQQRRYLDAGKLFCLLGIFRPMELRVWQGMALCARQLRAYPEALRALRRCTEIAPEEFEFVFAAIDCALLAGERTLALALLNEVVRKGREQSRPEHVARALEHLSRLQGASDEPQH